MSYTQAAQQKKNMKEAESAAAKAVADARAKLTQAPLERLQVPTEAYETAQREITAQSMQAIEAAREAGARELAASVGRVGALGLTAAERQREAMAQDIYKRDLAVAEDEARRLGLLSNLDVSEALGAQVAAAQAEEAAGKAMTSGTTGLVNAAGILATGMPLYKKAREAAAGMGAAEGIGEAAGSPQQAEVTNQGNDHARMRHIHHHGDAGGQGAEQQRHGQQHVGVLDQLIGCQRRFRGANNGIILIHRFLDS